MGATERRKKSSALLIHFAILILSEHLSELCCGEIPQDLLELPMELNSSTPRITVNNHVFHGHLIAASRALDEQNIVFDLFQLPHPFPLCARKEKIWQLHFLHRNEQLLVRKLNHSSTHAHNSNTITTIKHLISVSKSHILFSHTLPTPTKFCVYWLPYNNY